MGLGEIVAEDRIKDLFTAETQRVAEKSFRDLSELLLAQCGGMRRADEKFCGACALLGWTDECVRPNGKLLFEEGDLALVGLAAFAAAVGGSDNG